MTSDEKTDSRTVPLPIRSLLALTVLALTACASPAYYWQASKGHLQLMSERREVDEIMADPATSEQLKERLQLATKLLDFAEQSLDLPGGDSYRTLVEVGGPVTWNVVAAAEFSLQPKRWCFPVAGCVAYRGYFDRSDAKDFSDRMSRKGLDVAVFPASAYSTLGWFEDPLLDTMLEQSAAQLAGTLFHELAHQRLYVRDSTAFNEAYASFVEANGVRLWLQSRPDKADELQQWEQAREAIGDLNSLLNETRNQLETLYNAEIDPEEMRARKELVFNELRDNYQQLVTVAWQGRNHFGSWMEQDLNNASLATFRAYIGGHCAFTALLNEAGNEFARFHELAAGQAALDPVDRDQWLKQPCQAIASPGDL